MHLAVGQTDTAHLGILAKTLVIPCSAGSIGANSGKVGPSGGFLTSREKSGLDLKV